MVLHQGDEEEVTTASTASATSEAAARAVDSSDTATPSLGTPSDSLDRNIDPKQIMNSSEDIESEPQVESSVIEEQNEQTNINETSSETHDEEAGLIIDNQSSSILQAPPPSYSELKQEAISVEKQDISGKQQNTIICWTKVFYLKLM